METVQSYKLQIDMILQKSKNLPELKMMDQYKIIIICLIYVWTLQYQVSQMPSAVGWNAKPCESRQMRNHLCNIEKVMKFVLYLSNETNF